MLSRRSCRSYLSFLTDHPEIFTYNGMVASIDKKEYFKNPVSKVDVPDYFDIIKEPMCWTIIDGKLDRHEYWDVQAFKVCTHSVRALKCLILFYL